MLRAIVPLLALAASINAAPFHKSQKRQNGVVYNCNSNYFAYTWDDGPYIYHNEILDHFDGVGKKTTFFMNGDNWSCIYDSDNVAAIRRSYEEGHQVASHTWSHADLTTLTHAQIDVELERLDQAFVNILGVKPRFLRPPYGSINDEVAAYIQNTHGKIIVMWSDDSTDSVGGSVQDSVNFYNNLANENPKGPHICLSHETEPSGIGALEQGTVENLNSHGVNMVTVATCIDEDPYEVVTGVYGTPDSTWYCGGTWTPPPPVSSTTTTTGTCVAQYSSVAGDTCDSIGAKYGLTGAQILAANSFLTCNDIWVNTPICIPRGGSTSTSTTPTSTSTSSTAAPTCVSTYTSAAGDTCASIGAKYGLTAAQILAANTFLTCNDIWTYTPVCIPPGGSTSTSTTPTSTSSTAAPTCVSTYISAAGDTCASIGAKYGLTAAQILAANTFLTCNDIWTYTPVCIPNGGTGPTSSTSSTPTTSSTSSSSSPAPSCVSTYTSVAGDTCDSIGAKYGLTGAQILAANTFLTCNDIWTYTPVCIPPGGSGVCTRTISSTAGATCDSIAAQYGITAAQVQAWNTFVTCNDIWTNTPICVAHT